MFRRTVIAIAATTLLAAAPAGAAKKGPHAPVKPHGKPHTARVSAGATGQGPADQAECDRWASAINSWEMASDVALVNDDPEGSAHADTYAEGLENEAQNRGCFIVH